MKCDFCGKEGIYAMYLCETCYQRMIARRKRGIPIDLPVGYRKLSPERMKIWDMYKGGMSQSEIARNLGLSRQRISVIIKEQKQVMEGV